MLTSPQSLASGVIIDTNWAAIYTCPALTAAIGLVLEASNTDITDDSYLLCRVTRFGESAVQTRRGLLQSNGGWGVVNLTRLSAGDIIEIKSTVAITSLEWVLSGAEVSTV